MKDAELEEALQIFAKIVGSLPTGSSSKNYFLACCSPCDCPNETSDFCRSLISAPATSSSRACP